MRAEDAVVGTDTAAEILGVKPSNVGKMLARAGVESIGVPPSFGLGRRTLYPRGAVEALAVERERDERGRLVRERQRQAALRRNGAT